jgi:hypothetical protein
MGFAIIPLNRRAATSKAGFVRWAILVVHLYFRQRVRKTFDYWNARQAKTLPATHSEKRHEFSEHPICAINGVVI